MSVWLVLDCDFELMLERFWTACAVLGDCALGGGGVKTSIVKTTSVQVLARKRGLGVKPPLFFSSTT